MQEKVPEFFYKMLLEQYGKEIAEKIIDGYSFKRPVTLRVNTIKSNISNIKQELTNAGVEFEEVIWNKDALIIKNVKECEIREMSIYINGEIYLQSLSSMIPPIILDPKPKENILDMAAAPGGKTTRNSGVI